METGNDIHGGCIFEPKSKKMNEHLPSRSEGEKRAFAEGSLCGWEHPRASHYPCCIFLPLQAYHSLKVQQKSIYLTFSFFKYIFSDF